MIDAVHKAAGLANNNAHTRECLAQGSASMGSSDLLNSAETGKMLHFEAGVVE